MRDMVCVTMNGNARGTHSESVILLCHVHFYVGTSFFMVTYVTRIAKGFYVILFS